MTLHRINSLRQLDHQQLAEVAANRGLIRSAEGWAREYSRDSLRLKIIDDICAEELRVKREGDVERREKMRRQAQIDRLEGEGRR